ncbi:hypothetical protein GCM10007938_27090 [Vibrio zhanjiangensis]|uniref:Uncharacterized protein n=1 Tax=Vibrio zhanjiangensis TaxID=1046128 RepID=A0ABQ6F2I5_9VIBR|nr:hypothetical protein [Vibrio zhanjiangensis]GLT18927.1 hypothetical protein GCM10007938_27090 [Vibrio zhanjiangensis]
MLKKLLFISFLLPCLAFANEGALESSNTDSVSSSETLIPGGWSEFRTTLTRDDYSIFYQALGGLVGVSYSPFAVSSSVTAGMSYKFICNAQATYPNAPIYAAVVEVYHPINGIPELVSINEIN